MAYVQFWKGLAADYNAASHQDGIYQCTDTGDTYIFGVLNSGSGGGAPGDFATKDELEQGLAGKANTNHTHSNASTTAAGFMSASDKSKLDSLKATTINATEAGFTSPIPLDQYSVYSVMVHTNVILSFSGSLEKGQEFFLILRNPEANVYTVTFPSSSTFVSLSGDSMELPGHGYIEISILRDANGDYLIRAAASIE